MTTLFATKGATLERLAPRLRGAKILPQIRFRVVEWNRSRTVVIKALRSGGWFSRPVIVRSSARREDGFASSMAGMFTSVANVRDEAAVVDAIEQVVRSYGELDDGDEVFLQPQLESATVNGVAFGLEPNTGGPYVVINYDDVGPLGTITGGVSGDDQTFYWHRDAAPPQNPLLVAVIALMAELEALFGTEALDLEFAWSAEQLYLLQVRPLAKVAVNAGDRAQSCEHLHAIAARIDAHATACSKRLGSGVALGVMPDWNPAEMIGLRPRPLAVSLYRVCITDRVWAEQRRDYGYRDVVGSPLMECYGGQPYIDVRASFTSFVPAEVGVPLAGKLVEHYLDGLRARPELHDKVELELLYHCLTFDLSDRLRTLRGAGFSASECDALTAALRRLTVRVVDQDRGPWAEDRLRLSRFAAKLERWTRSGPSETANLRTLLHACINEGARPFAGLARAGFVAVSMLRSMVQVGVWTVEDEERFLRSLRTIISRMRADRVRCSREEFLARYGHLRPGTYDILTPRYDETPERYFLADPTDDPGPPEPFVPTARQRRGLAQLLRRNRLPVDPDQFVRFLGEAIEAREYGKFVYSRGVSEILRSVGALGARFGLSLDDCSYAEIGHFCDAPSSDSRGTSLEPAIAAGRADHGATVGLALPPLLLASRDVWSFHHLRSQPNYITRGMAQGPVVTIASDRAEFTGGVLLLPCADPGFDWIFTARIAALVTMFGGANSHMAIRARELGVPAAIGVGEPLFHRLSKARALRVDCAGKQLVEIP